MGCFFFINNKQTKKLPHVWYHCVCNNLYYTTHIFLYSCVKAMKNKKTMPKLLCLFSYPHKKRIESNQKILCILKWYILLLSIIQQHPCKIQNLKCAPQCVYYVFSSYILHIIDCKVYRQ